MADIRVEHVFECSPDTFWSRIIFDAEFNRKMYVEQLGFSAWRVLETREDDLTLKRIIEVIPPVGDLPGPLRKLIGSGFGYREEGTFDKKTQRYHVKAIPNRLADKLSVQGELWCDSLGEARCRRIFEGTIEARIFGLGGLLKSRLIADMKRSYDAGARCTSEHLSELANK